MKNHKSYEKKAILICVSCFFFMLCVFSTAAAENYIGIILNGYQKDCLVHSMGEDYYCSEKRQLYAGDKITKKQNIKELKIKWAPYASGKELDKTSLLVTFEPPKDKKSIVLSVKEILGFVKTGHSVSIGATRNISDGVVFQPGNNATLIPGQKTTFLWESVGGKYIIFKNSSGMEIFRKDLKSEEFINLTPEEIGMKQGEVYLWNISGIKNNRQYKIRLLDQDITGLVNEDLKKIERETTSSANKMIQKAGYLQFISDAYPQDIDLYWLSYLILGENKNENTLNEDEKIIFENLKSNYKGHVRESM